VKVIIVSVLCLLASMAVRAQDAQFWHNHYGTKATLLGGAVIGSVEDLSAVFYNPGYLGLKQQPGLAIGTSVFDVMYLELDTDSLFQHPVDRITAEAAPGLIAGQVKIRDSARHFFTYSLIGRQSFNTMVQGRSDGADAEGSRMATLYLRQDMMEYWGGVTWSTSIGHNLGLGVSLFGAYRNQRRRNEITVDSTLADGSVNHASADVGWFFWNLRLLTKAGLFWTEDAWSAGVTVTTPALSLFGYGEAYGTYVVAGKGAGTDDVVDFQNPGSGSVYHSPLSIGIGVGHRINNVRLHGSLEWFASVDAYHVMDPAEATRPTSIRSVPVIDQMRSIVNVGFGIEVRVSDRFAYYGSLVTDLSTVSSEFDRVLALSTWDIFHVNGGAVFQIDRFILTGGLGLAYGTGTPLTLTRSPIEGRDLGPDGRVDVIWGRVRAIVGLTYAP